MKYNTIGVNVSLIIISYSYFSSYSFWPPLNPSSQSTTSRPTLLTLLLTQPAIINLKDYWFIILAFIMILIKAILASIIGALEIGCGLATLIRFGWRL